MSDTQGNLKNITGIACPACAGTNLEIIYTVRNIPVQSCVLLDSEQQALDYPRRDLELAFCSSCGLAFNHLFDESIVDYTSKTEESQHFSGTFSKFAKELAKEIAEKSELQGKTVLEIGCGKGDFLLELCSLKPCKGIGIDPGYIPGSQRLHTTTDHIEFIVDYFGPGYRHIEADIVICRHTLEHVARPAEFVRNIRMNIGEKRNVCVFFETPDARRVFNEGAFWDIYYEHSNYFTEGTHARLFRQERFKITELGLMYDNQYIYQYAVPASDRTDPQLQNELDLEQLQNDIKVFQKKIYGLQDHWRKVVQERFNAGERTVIWGGGSKCVAFLTTLNLSAEVSSVIDINPHKQGKYLPGTGHKIISPESLPQEGNRPDLVIIMNPVYINEISMQLNSMNINPQILAL